MEHVHGIDVSWMTHGSPKDKASKTTKPLSSIVTSPQAGESPHPSPNAASPTTGNANATNMAKSIPGSRPGLGRNNSFEKMAAANGGSPSQRKGSWFSNISSKFSSSPTAAQLAPATDTTPPNPTVPPVPKVTPAKNAVLAHATKFEGDGPYIPAPPRSGQAGFLGVFRRLSSSGGVLSPGVKGNHGLVERRVLNVDQHRQRCPISELDNAKLRRVAFCVDVEIAPMPKYAEPDIATKKIDKTQKRKIVEKGEGEALKNPKAAEEQKEADIAAKRTAEQAAIDPEDDGADELSPNTEEAGEGIGKAGDKDKDNCKRKEKKKKSEEERKARKEKRRKLAEANGTIPMEIHVDSSDSSRCGSPTGGVSTQKMTTFPTTNPVRIYRRCCQLRETPILKKVTEQLINPANTDSETGAVEKLDLTGYWLQLPDLVTLGDYFAVVPVKEVILENCGLTDESLRVVLAGLLAARVANPNRRPPPTHPDGLTTQGGVVQKLVLKNNKIGAGGWKHICLFLYMCRSLQCLDVSKIPFPRPLAQPVAQPLQNGAQPSDASAPLEFAKLFSKSIGERIGGSELELLNIGETDPTPEQLHTIMDGIIQCGVRRLGLANNHLDEQGVEDLARYLAGGKCEGLDLGGNDLGDRMAVVAKNIQDGDPLWALSLADCNLKPSSLCKIFPKLVKLKDFRFLDLSHNHGLFDSTPSSISLLRRYLPKMDNLKRIHLADVAMTPKQAITLAEILPEAKGLAHINLLENPQLQELADARTEETQEEACAFYASLLAATRVSKSIVLVDVDVPSEESGEIVKALAKQVVAYCLRNMERFPVGDIESAVNGAMSDIRSEETVPPVPYPDVLVHLVGHDVLEDDTEADNESAPDEDYVIGGTGVVKALQCCLENRGDESRRQSGEFIRDMENGNITPVTPTNQLPHGKAKDMSKHLLASARKIRQRLQPALKKAKSEPRDPEYNLMRLKFLDRTLAGIIKRFEDEFPETRVESPGLTGPELVHTALDTVPASIAPPQTESEVEKEPEQEAIASDVEDTEIHVRPLSRSNSILSHTSRALVNEEGRALRAGHRFRSGITQEHFNMLNRGIEEIGAEPNHARILEELVEELGDAELLQKLKEKGSVQTFIEEKDKIRDRLREKDPEHWTRFKESQDKARANVQMAADGETRPDPPTDEDAVVDDEE